MKKCILLLFVFITAVLVAQEAKPQAETTPSTSAAPHKTYRQLDAEVKDGTYTNRYFGFAYTIPDGWDSHDEETKKRLLEMGEDKLKKGDQPQPAQPGPEQGFFMLLLATPKEVFFPQVSLMAQDVVLIPQIKTGADFIELLSGEFKSQPTYSLTKATEKFPLGDHEFYKSEFKNGAVYQAAVFTIMRRHAVGFILSAANDKDLQDLIASVQKTKFMAPKDADK